MDRAAPPPSCLRRCLRRCLRGAAWALLGAALLAPALQAAQPALPARNLRAQWRVIDARSAGDAGDAGDAGRGGGRSVSTQTSTRTSTQTLEATDELAVTVLNGHWARLRVAQSIPVQWVRAAAQSVAAGGGSGGNNANNSANNSAGVVNAITWIDAGQGLALRVRWPGHGAAEVDLDADATHRQPGGQAPLPATRREQAATTLAVPIGPWVTVAVVGSAGDGGAPASAGRHWGTDTLGGGPRLMQLRLTLP